MVDSFRRLHVAKASGRSREGVDAAAALRGGIGGLLLMCFEQRGADLRGEGQMNALAAVFRAQIATDAQQRVPQHLAGESARRTCGRLIGLRENDERVQLLEAEVLPR